MIRRVHRLLVVALAVVTSGLKIVPQKRCW